VGFVKNFLLTALGFLLVILVRGAVLPHVPGVIETRTASLVASRRSCSILFLGPSYVGNMIEPKAFNAEAKRIGFNATACKYGTEAFKGYELRLWIERLLAHDWPRLKVVVIDITLGDTIGFNPDNWFKPRTLEWHTASAVPWLFNYYRKRAPGRAPEHARLFVSHLEHVAAHYLEIGQGTEALDRLRVMERLVPAVAREEPAVDAKRSVREAKAKKNLKGAAYEQQVKKLAASKKKRAFGPSQWPLELRDVVRQRGAEAYFLLAPVLYSRAKPSAAAAGPDRLVLLDFNDPERYPELYAEKVRGNTSHLNRAGIPLYSKILARKLYRQSRRAR